MDSDPRPLWTPRPRVGDTEGEPPGCNRMAPRVSGSSEPLTEGIHKDTDGPDQASDSSQDIAHLPGRHFALADFDMSAFRLGHGPHLLSGSLPPRQDTRCSGRGRRGGPHQHARPTRHRLLSIAAESSGPGEESARHQRTPIPTFPRDSNPLSRVASPSPTPPSSLDRRGGQEAAQGRSGPSQQTAPRRFPRPPRQAASRSE